jgi:hypothetical protein
VASCRRNRFRFNLGILALNGAKFRSFCTDCVFRTHELPTTKPSLKQLALLNPEPAWAPSHLPEQGHTMQAVCRHRTRVGSRVLSQARGLPPDRRPCRHTAPQSAPRPRLRGCKGQYALVITHGPQYQELRRSSHSQGNIQLVLSSCVWIADTPTLLRCAPPTLLCWPNAPSATTSECSECTPDPYTATPPLRRRSVPSQATLPSLVDACRRGRLASKSRLSTVFGRSASASVRTWNVVSTGRGEGGIFIASKNNF